MQLMRVIFVISLGFNLFIVGWWLGDQWRRPAPQGPRPLNFTAFLQHRLDLSTLDLIREPLDDVNEIMRAGFNARREIFKKLRTLVSQEPYDRQAVEALLLELPSRRFANEQMQWKMVGVVLAKLSAAERKSFAELVFPQPIGFPPPPSPPEAHQ